MKETVLTSTKMENTDKMIIASNEDQMTSLKVEYRPDGRLWASHNGSESAVRVNRCFPWSEPDGYVSLRDDDENEVALIVELTDLDADSRAAVEKALIETGFVMEIVNIYSLEEDFEIRSWKVQTAQGERKFQTRLDDWPISLPGGGILIRDVAGDLFYIHDTESLDEQSRKLIWAFVG